MYKRLYFTTNQIYHYPLYLVQNRGEGRGYYSNFRWNVNAFEKLFSKTWKTYSMLYRFETTHTMFIHLHLWYIGLVKCHICRMIKCDNELETELRTCLCTFTLRSRKTSARRLKCCATSHCLKWGPFSPIRLADYTEYRSLKSMAVLTNYEKLGYISFMNHWKQNSNIVIWFYNR